jgi:hypothetical protein
MKGFCGKRGLILSKTKKDEEKEEEARRRMKEATSRPRPRPRTSSTNHKSRKCKKKDWGKVSQNGDVGEGRGIKRMRDRSNKICGSD